MAWILESLEMSIRFSLHIVNVLLWEPMATQTLTKVISLPCTKYVKKNICNACMYIHLYIHSGIAGCSDKKDTSYSES